MSLGIAGRLTRAFIASPLSPLLLLAALALGLVALVTLPREEEPQISVPMVDVRVRADGLKAEDAVKLVTERGVSIAQAARDLDVHETMVRTWVKELGKDPEHAFPGKGVMKPEQAEIERLKKEVAKLKMERDILKKAAAYFAKDSL